MLWFSDEPDFMDVLIVKNDFTPTGMGEAPYPLVAPALCNAIFIVIGKWIRKLPIKDPQILA